MRLKIMSLELKNLSLSRSGVKLIDGLSFIVNPGECIVIRGKNGVGKSSILSAIMGLSGVDVTGGDVELYKVSILDKKIFERARLGIFLAHQEPPIIDGVSLGFMVRTALSAMKGIDDVPGAQKRIRGAASMLNLADDFATKTLHGDMSGGEKKRAELLQMMVIEPKFVLLDEIDSGLDAASIAIATSVIARMRLAGTGFVVVTHSDSFAESINPTQIIEL